jgi:GNAT superfamily N-acetyltransferase
MDLAGLSLVKIKPSTVIKPFDCGNADLNEFLFEKSILYSKELLATTYLLEDATDTIAYFSIFNDTLKVEEADFVSKNAWKKWLADLVPHGKRHLKHFPAIKIGRLGVSNTKQRGGIGTIIISFVLDLALSHNEDCACRFISVDAKSNSLEFYEKKGFSMYTSKDINEEARQMYLDLTPFINTSESISTELTSP